MSNNSEGSENCAGAIGDAGSVNSVSSRASQMGTSPISDKRGEVSSPNQGSKAEESTPADAMQSDIPAESEVSARKVTANRRNALKSTGPKSEEGKSIVRDNARKHGVLAKETLIPGETPREFADELTSVWDYYQPVGPIEEHVVREIVVGLWRLRRVRRCETAETTQAVQSKVRALKFFPASEVEKWETKSEGVLWLLDALDDLEREIRDKEELTIEAHSSLECYFRRSEDFAAYFETDEPSMEAILDMIATHRPHPLARYRELQVKERRDAKMIALQRSVPNDETLNRLQRYETAIRRQLDRDLVTLERLQRQRKGDYVPPPLSVSVQGLS